MQSRHRLTVLAIAMLGLILSAAQSRAADTYKLDPVHSFAIFKVGHMNTSYVYGRFDEPTGTITATGEDPESVDIEIPVKNVDTGTEQRDKHLKSPSFFDVAQFPTIAFKSKSIKKTGDKTYEVTGDLTLHGVTKPLTFTLERVGVSDNPQMGHRMGFESKFTVKRSDFGMNFMPTAVGDDITLMVSVETVKQ